MLRCLAVAAVLAAAAATAPAGSSAQLRTAIIDPSAFNGARAARAFDRTHATGASMVRLLLQWDAVAPRRRPVGFDATDPGARAYTWGWFDRQVRLATARGLTPIVTLMYAPRWASSPGPGPAGTVRPNAVELGKFARAAARRYSGTFEDLPRVPYWQVWNEPNRDYFLRPQYAGGQLVSASRYRALVNRVAAAVRAVDGRNVVVAGGLAPYGRRGKPAPLAFMRSMFCISRSARRTCDLRSRPARFDVWSHHPYTSGGPARAAARPDDVALGDLPEMRRLLRAAVRLGHVRPRGRVGFWVTEFAWDSSPPDPRAVPAWLHARWVSEALYRMWRSGVSVVTWYRIQDDRLRASPYQSGFYTVSGRRKRSLTAFRFPTVAFATRAGVFVWGRTPAGQPGRVALEITSGTGWRRLGTRRTASGMFSATYRTPIRRGYVRARFGRAASVPFSLTRPPDRSVNPFGCGGWVRC
jgi:hypothetical protein